MVVIEADEPDYRGYELPQKVHQKCTENASKMHRSDAVLMSVSDLGVFDLQHASRLDQIDAALAALGRRLVVTSEIA